MSDSKNLEEQRRKAALRQRTYRARHRERILARRHIFYQDHIEELRAKARQSMRALRARDPEKNRAYQRAYRAKNRERLTAHARAYYKKKAPSILARNRRYRTAHAAQYRELRRKYRREDPERFRKYADTKKKRALDRIGGASCPACGCDDIWALEINHIYGGGTKEHKAFRQVGSRLYADIRAGRRRIEDLNVLCRPCNRVDDVLRRYAPLSGRWVIRWVPNVVPGAS